MFLHHTTPCKRNIYYFKFPLIAKKKWKKINLVFEIKRFFDVINKCQTLAGQV